MKRRLLVLAALAAGGLPVLWLLGRFWRCPILAYTGLPCPGCGMTRAAAALLRLDWAGAWGHNPAVYAALAYLLAAAAAYLTGRGALLRKAWFWVSLALVLAAVWGLRLAAGLL